MADWTQLDVNTLLPGEPWTSAKALALNENPIALAEGATGAPKIKGEALGIYAGFQSATGGARVTGYPILPRTRFIRVDFESLNRFQVEWSNDGGSTWTTPQDLTGDTNQRGFVIIDVTNGEARGTASTLINVDLTLIPVGVNAVSFRSLTNNVAVMLTYLGGVAP